MKKHNLESVLQQITIIESQLRALRIDLEEEEAAENTTRNTTVPLRVGDRVQIKNPKGSQPTQGILSKIHRTKRGTVTAKNAQGKEIKVVRLLSNLSRQNEDE